jgi:hypothetical protein
MTDQTNQPDNQPNDMINEGIGFEESDISVRGMVISGVVIFLLTVAAMFLILAFVRGLEGRAELASPGAAPASEAQPTPPQPRLQPNPLDGTTAEEQMVEMITDQTELLKTYGWVDKEAGIARIPVDTAILILTPDEGEPPK